MHVNYIEWRIHPFRRDRWLEAWSPAIERAAAFGAAACYLTRNVDDPLHFRQMSIWSDRADFERYWASDEVAALRQDALNYYNKPVLHAWHAVAGQSVPGAGAGDAAPAEVVD
ncbi:MAG: antibiotic biosynthesis monooxygenase [Solirubrobacterales bacterium]